LKSYGRKSCSNHDRKLPIRFANRSSALHPVSLVSKSLIRDSSYSNVTNNARFRFLIEWIVEKLWLEMRSLVSWISYSNHDRKFGFRLANHCFFRHLVRLVTKSSSNYSLYYNVTNNARFRFAIGWIHEKLWLEMRSWVSWISCSNHDQKFNFRYANHCVFRHLVRLVSKSSTNYSSYCNLTNIVRFRFAIEWILEKLWLEIQKIGCRIFHIPTKTENSRSCLQIVVSFVTWYISFNSLVRNILCNVIW
jgi:hypothetical protein